jgi:uncharacterized protein YndB with AHSA1/START domain
MAVTGDRIEHEIRVAAPVELVFAYFVDERRHLDWMGQQVELDPRPGGIYRAAMPDATVVVGTYLAVDPPHRVVFTWGYEGDATIPPGSSTVEVTLVSDGDATLVRLVHIGLPHPQLGPHDQGWRGYLARLAAL